MDSPSNAHWLHVNQTAFQCLAIVGRFFNIPVNPEQLQRQFGVSATEASHSPSSQTSSSQTTISQPSTQQRININLARAAKQINLKSRKMALSQLANHALDKSLFPAIAQHKNGQFFIVANVKQAPSKSGDERSQLTFLIQDVTQPAPQILSEEQFQNISSGELLLFSKRTHWIDEKAKFGLSWFVPAIKKYKKYLGDVLAASFFIQLLGVASPVFFQIVIDKVLVHKGMTTLDVLAVGFFLVITFEVLLTALRTYLFAHTTNRIDVELGSKLYQHLLNLPAHFFATSRVGQTVARVKELDKIREFITGTSLTLALDVLFGVVFIALMFFYAPLLTWIVIGTIPAYVLLSVLITPALRQKLEQQFQRSADNHAFLVESVTGAETIKSLAVEPNMREQWDDKLAAYVSTAFSTHNLSNIYQQLAAYINKIGSLLTLYFGAIAVVAGELTIGQFIAFNMLAQRVSGPIMRLVNVWQEFQQANISLKRLGDILNLPTEQGHTLSRNTLPNKHTLPNIAGKVEFQNVTFRYQVQQPATLSEVSFSVAAGEVIGLVGRSGSGKSTLTKLIQRLYLPEAGRVLVDGADLAMVDPAWLRQQIGVVLQENFLFNRSVRENIALAEPGTPFENVINAAKLAGAHDFILELPEGYDTLVGEQGSSLSGGQRQRIAIARALLSNPRILIFDEATSALDYESEHIIQQNMRDICQGRTVFIIAHRLSAVRLANRIFVVEKGRIAEQGNHPQLLAQQGIYHTLYQLQHVADSNQSIESQSTDSGSVQSSSAKLTL